jgi:asparagine synthase (glutamine-hydrolysing)
MKLAALFSGGKDSAFAAYKAMKEGNTISCLISMKPENTESYMFHSANIDLVKLQAEAMELPLIFAATKGEKELELADLKKAIEQAKKKYAIEGVVAGAIASTYQFDRLKKICDELKLKAVAPLWHIDHEDYMHNLVHSGFEVIITAIAAEGLTASFLGKKIDDSMIAKLISLNKNKKFGISICGEGGEYESLVLNCPLFKKRLEILVDKIEMEQGSENTGIYRIRKAKLVS